jgi:hypothetical protein
MGLEQAVLAVATTGVAVAVVLEPRLVVKLVEMAFQTP